MTSENDFQQILDANPEDFQTRLVFADWLQERGDPRAEGYRTMGVLKRKPLINGSGCWWHCGSSVPNSLPPDWFKLLPELTVKSTILWPVEPNLFPDDRANVEDAAAIAFSKLPPERRAELLSGKRD